MKKEYSRDKRSPKPKNENVSRSMSGNKAKDTKPELILRKALWAKGLRGYRIHNKNLPGRPDIVFSKKKLAIFVHGCFWHRCPHCDLPLLKNNTEFWKNKFEKNMERDAKKRKLLKKEGWRVKVIWECGINSDLGGCVKNIKDIK